MVGHTGEKKISFFQQKQIRVGGAQDKQMRLASKVPF